MQHDRWPDADTVRERLHGRRADLDLALEGLRELGVFDETVTVELAGYPDHPYRRTFRAVWDWKIIAIVTVLGHQPEPDAPPDPPTLYFAGEYWVCDGPGA